MKIKNKGWFLSATTPHTCIFYLFPPLFFSSINLTPQTMGSCPPHTFRPSLASSPTHPLTSSPSPIWLLFKHFKRWPPKAKADPPLSIFWCLSFCPPKQANQPQQARAWRLVTCTHLLGSSGNIICGQLCSAHGEREGKAAGGWGCTGEFWNK